MKPLLTLELMLGGVPMPARHGACAAGRHASDDLDFRLVQIVWASGEGLDSPVPTRGTALLQHGFKEWGAAVGVSTVGRDEVWPTVQHCEEQNLMPVLLCRDVAAPLEVLQHMLAQGSCALLALGSPTRLSLAPRNPDLAGSVFPLRVTSGIDLGLCVWLGAPDGLPQPAFALPGSLRVASHELKALGIVQHLQAVQRRWVDLAPASVWCVVFLDDVQLGGEPATSCSGLPPTALAATLSWLQGLVPSVAVCLVSHERVTPAQRGPMAELARHLGGALHRHRGVRREAFTAHTQKRR